MTIQEILRQMRDPEADNERLLWADAIEAAMREPVGEVGYAWKGASTSQATHYGVPYIALGEQNVPPGTKLYTLPPDAQAEIERLREGLDLALKCGKPASGMEPLIGWQHAEYIAALSGDKK